jgi:signal transduction histidine kinase
MTHRPEPSLVPRPVPHIAPPRPGAERRTRSRRVADRLALEEAALLSRALDVFAAEIPAEARLAGVLDLLADTVGAVRAAVIADGPTRRVAVAASDADDAADASALAAWLDATAPRSRARRAAAAPATILVAYRGPRTIGRSRRSGRAPHHACLPIPMAGDVSLGFAFTKSTEAGTLADRLPPTLARHAAVALALVTATLTTERELAALRAGEAGRARYITTVAHELRTPLTGLTGYLDLILDDRVEDPAIRREFLERGRAIADGMTALVGDLLESSRLESGTLELDLGPFSVAEAIGAVASGLMPIALDRGVALVTDLPARMRTATADRRRVEQILTNLGANALKYGPAGGTVELVGRFDGPVAILAVRDEGAGIEPEDRDRIFEPFQRLPDHQRLTGTGLGLAIARDLARAMGGDLDVASEAGTGSTFVFVLPGPVGPVDGETLASALADALVLETERLRQRALGGRATGRGRRSGPDQDGGGDGGRRGRPSLAIGANR